MEDIENEREREGESVCQEREKVRWSVSDSVCERWRRESLVREGGAVCVCMCVCVRER